MADSKNTKTSEPAAAAAAAASTAVVAAANSESTPALTSDNKNSKLILCRYCDSRILLAGGGEFVVREIALPKSRAGDGNETLNHHWKVASQFAFENIGVTRPPPGGPVSDRPIKYLACADCDRGPVGIHYTSDGSFFVAHTRVRYEGEAPVALPAAVVAAQTAAAAALTASLTATATAMAAKQQKDGGGGGGDGDAAAKK